MSNPTPGLPIVEAWFEDRGWKPFDYQRQVWSAFLSGKNGLLKAPTGSGKTYALWIPVLINWINRHPETYRELADNGL
ncbi:MAG: DEAD/DEAH box helicase, partial [Balneolaceae bacterium]|nr:DEAD/DEAH box helicase [Balneolaceae bacterium]